MASEEKTFKDVEQTQIPDTYQDPMGPQGYHGKGSAQDGMAFSDAPVILQL